MKSVEAFRLLFTPESIVIGLEGCDSGGEIPCYALVIQ